MKNLIRLSIMLSCLFIVSCSQDEVVKNSEWEDDAIQKYLAAGFEFDDQCDLNKIDHVFMSYNEAMEFLQVYEKGRETIKEGSRTQDIRRIRFENRLTNGVYDCLVNYGYVEVGFKMNHKCEMDYSSIKITSETGYDVTKVVIKKLENPRIIVLLSYETTVVVNGKQMTAKDQIQTSFVFILNYFEVLCGMDYVNS